MSIRDVIERLEEAGYDIDEAEVNNLIAEYTDHGVDFDDDDDIYEYILENIEDE